MTGHKLVRFSAAERENLRRFADAGGLLFSDDCNHDVNGLYAKSFEQEMRSRFPTSRWRSCRRRTRSTAASSPFKAARRRRRTSSTAGATTSSTTT